MSIYDRTLASALDAIQGVLERDLQGLLDQDNLREGWSLSAPAHYHRGQSADVATSEGASLLLWSNLQATSPRAQGSGDVTSQIVMVLSLSVRDVGSNTPTPSTLHDAVSTYGERIVLALMSDVVDPAGRLRGVGVWSVGDARTFFDPPPPGPTQSAQTAKATFTLRITQRRIQHT